MGPAGAVTGGPEGAEKRGQTRAGARLVYNRDLVSLEEVAEAGERLAAIGSDIQVTVLDYFPAFRRRDLKRPSPREMLEVKKVLEAAGLKVVIVQTSRGHVGPGDRRRLGL